MIAPMQSLLNRQTIDFRPLLDWLQDRRAIADPGLLRLKLAARGTLSVMLTTVAVAVVAHLGGWSGVDFASGVTFSSMAPFMMRDQSPRQRRKTLLVLSIPATVATVFTASLHGHETAGAICFLGLVFLCFLVQPRSPRMTPIGFTAIVIAYIGLYLELPPRTIGLQILSIVIALPAVAFSCFVVVPMNATATLRQMLSAVRGRAARALQIAAKVEMAPSPARAAISLRRALVRLNEVALAADDQLAFLRPEGFETSRARLVHLELAIVRVIEALSVQVQGRRQHLRMMLHARRMRRGGRYAMTSTQAETGSLRSALVDLGHAVHALGEIGTDANWNVAAQAVKPPPGPFAWRTATRVTVAAALAMAAGMALSPQRWFWAVITVYVVFLNARSRGDTILKGAQRLAGTVLGIASGILVASVLAGRGGLEVGALCVTLFGMYYFLFTSYTIGIFFVTVLLGLLYGMLGASPEAVLVLRLEETAIGAVIGILVATFFMPVRTREQVRRSGRLVLGRLADAVRASREAMEGSSGLSPTEAMRRADRQIGDLRLALAPIVARRNLLRRNDLERPIPALRDCVHWTRALCATVVTDCPRVDLEPLRDQMKRIEGRLANLATEVASSDWTVSTTAPQSADSRTAKVKETLDGLEQAVALLAERLEIHALETFSVD